MINKQPILLKKYNAIKWIDISNYIDHNQLPGSSDPENNSLYQFSLGFIDPQDDNGNYITIENGDDIAILTSDSTQILDNLKLGCVTTKTIPPPVLDCSSGINRLKLSYSLTITQRDWSFYPLQLSNKVFDDNSNFQYLLTILTYIFSSNFVRDDLGGVMANGTIIDKFVLLGENIEMQVPEIEGISREILTEILNQIGYAWGVQSFSEPNAETTIKTFYQVVIWQQD